MGIDVFIYAEQKENDIWRYYGEFEIDNESEEEIIKPKEIYYPGPNSALNAILANYNNYGLVDNNNLIREEPYKYISLPRGLPKDLSNEIKVWADIVEEDMESPSWLLLRELLDFDWNQTIIKRRMVNSRFAHLFKDENKRFPFENWPKGEQISYSRYCSDGVFVSWTEAYSESVGKEFMNFLYNIGSMVELENTRFIFWFY